MSRLTVEQVIIISTAAVQYEADGVLDTATFMALNNSGLDADNIETLIEEAANG